jgi:hypothetical protein
VSPPVGLVDPERSISAVTASTLEAQQSSVELLRIAELLRSVSCLHDAHLARPLSWTTQASQLRAGRRITTRRTGQGAAVQSPLEAKGTARREFHLFSPAAILPLMPTPKPKIGDSQVLMRRLRRKPSFRRAPRRLQRCARIGTSWMSRRSASSRAAVPPSEHAACSCTSLCPS